MTRERDEVVLIGDDIKVMIVDIRGDSVRVGVDAPRYLTIHREEVYKHIQKDIRAGKSHAEPIPSKDRIAALLDAVVRELARISPAEQMQCMDNLTRRVMAIEPPGGKRAPASVP